MTKGKKFKNVVRERKQKTGERYQTARMHEGGRSKAAREEVAVATTSVDDVLRVYRDAGMSNSEIRRLLDDADAADDGSDKPKAVQPPTQYASPQPLHVEVRIPPPAVTLVPIVIGCVIESLGKVPDGNLIQVVEPILTMLLAELQRDPTFLFKIPPRKMEELVAAAYHADGFDEVILTPRTGDRGRDVIATRHGRFSIRVIDEVKAFAPGRLVSAHYVRALLGNLGSDRGATKAVVTTTSGFAPRIKTDPFIAPYMPHRLELIDGPQLLAWLNKLGRNQS